MILSIDPGINNCGLVILDIEKQFEVVETHLVKNARKFTDDEKVIETKFGNRTVKVLAILNKIKEIIKQYNIEYVVIEAPFYNALTPVAYGSLLEVIFAIRYTILFPENIQSKMIEPLLVKKLFTQQAMASKEVIKQFLLKKQEDKSIIINKVVEDLSEHEIDAVAIGFVHYLKVLEERSES
jgi:Holliday junction resolvasome RuvABC endonuclease subunit